MSQPRKVAQAYDFVSIFTGTVTLAAAVRVPFTPINYTPPGGQPPGAPTDAVPVLVAHEILITNPTANTLKVAVCDVNGNWPNGGTNPKLSPSIDGQQIAELKPVWLDPTTMPAISGSNFITVPGNCIAFPIKVRAYGITIQANTADAAGVSIEAYGPLSLLS